MEQTSSELTQITNYQSKIYHSACLISIVQIIFASTDVYKTLLSLCRFNLCISNTSKRVVLRVVIQEFNRLCGTEVYNAEMSYVWTDIAVCTLSWSKDDSSTGEFLAIHTRLTSLRLV